MMEQTLTLHTDDLLDPASSPLRILERIKGRRLTA